MSCEHLICAQCAGPVVEGRCAACRQARAEVHHTQPGLRVPLLIMVLVATLLLMLALRLVH
jgi:predicted RNA-binding protein with PUA domain